MQICKNFKSGIQPYKVEGKDCHINLVLKLNTPKPCQYRIIVGNKNIVVDAFFFSERKLYYIIDFEFRRFTTDEVVYYNYTYNIFAIERVQHEVVITTHLGNFKFICRTIGYLFVKDRVY